MGSWYKVVHTQAWELVALQIYLPDTFVKACDQLANFSLQTTVVGVFGSTLEVWCLQYVWLHGTER